MIFMRVLCRGRIVNKCGVLVFVGGRKPKNLETGLESNPGHIGGIEGKALATAPSPLQTNDNREGDTFQ